MSQKENGMPEKEMIALLEGSIEHWKRLKGCRTPEQIRMEGTGVSSCPLCIRFFVGRCCECPVSEWSGKAKCYGTPYMEAMAYYHLHRWAPEYLNPSVWQELAQDEIDFLEVVLKNENH